MEGKNSKIYLGMEKSLGKKQEPSQLITPVAVTLECCHLAVEWVNRDFLFIFLIFLSQLCTQCEARTHNREIKSHSVNQARPVPPKLFIWKSSQTYKKNYKKKKKITRIVHWSAPVHLLGIMYEHPALVILPLSTRIHIPVASFLPVIDGYIFTGQSVL